MPSDCLVNGRRDAHLSPFDRGFSYGDGVFRTLPVWGGRPHCWERHYRKLCEDCKALGIVCPPENMLLSDMALLLDGHENATIKIIISRGESARGYAVPPLAQPTRVVMRTPEPRYAISNVSEGVKLHLCDLRLSHQPRLAGIKHLNRLENVLARMEWVDPAYVEGLLLDTDGRVVECTASNIFIRVGSCLQTPMLNRCGVAGVARERILEIAPHMGYQPEITDFSLEQLIDADEVIVCNSLFGAWQVRELGKRSWSRGELAARLHENLLINDTPAI